eukprot:757022-Hanusia_phi.AAC.3
MKPGAVFRLPPIHSARPGPSVGAATAAADRTIIRARRRSVNLLSHRIICHDYQIRCQVIHGPGTKERYRLNDSNRVFESEVPGVPKFSNKRRT